MQERPGADEPIIPTPTQDWTRKLSTNWGAVVFLALSPVAALISGIWYVNEYGLGFGEAALWIGMHYVTGLGITAGYHRCYSHRTHDAHPILQFVYLMLGAATMQQNVIFWSRNHRVHHRFADTNLDPHNIKQGFFHAHMGWIFQNRPLDDDFSTVKDLMNDPLARWQMKYYWPIFFVTGVFVPTLIGWACFGSALGGFLWGSLIRLVVQNHVVYSINSIAHTWGKQTYSLKGEARDSWFLALLSNGEGFHSFHHRFAFDYRNGHRWYEWDASKYFIRTMEFIGLASNLKRASDSAILKARVSTERERVAEALKRLPPEKQSDWSRKLQDAHAHLDTMLAHWQEAKESFREYKELRKRQAIEFSRAEYELLKRKLAERKQALRLSEQHWSALVASLAIFLR